MNFLDTTTLSTYTLAHRHMIGTLQIYTNLTSLYAVTLSNNKMLAVKNTSGVFVAQIGDGSCLRSYAVTVGATALATTVDYSTHTAEDCNFAVNGQVSSVSVSSALMLRQ